MKSLAEKPLVTKAATSATLMGLGDVFTQTVVQGKIIGKDFDFLRTGRMVTYSM